ncbi:MAG: xylulokinase [Phycisphaerales bacterium]
MTPSQSDPPMLLGIDIGTSATKVIAVARDGSICASASHGYPISQPQQGWSEQQPNDWWHSVCSAVREVTASVEAASIEALGLSGQMHGLVLLDEGNAVIRPAILWNDQRTAVQCSELESLAGGRESLQRITGNIALPGLTMPKLRWLEQHEPATLSRARTLLLPKDFVAHRLTGCRTTDVGDASGTMLFDLAKRAWSSTLIDAFGVDAAILPSILASHEIAGRVNDAAAGACGVRAGAPVVIGSGDQMTGAVGMGIVESGSVSITLGTSGVVFVHLGAMLPLERSPSLQYMASAVANEYCLYGCMLSAAGAYEWFRNVMAPGISFAQLDAEAAAIAPGCDGVSFSPHLSGERCPFVDATATASFAGLAAHHTRGHLARAVLEGVANNLAAILELIEDATAVEIHDVRVGGGGAQSQLWIDIIERAVERPLARVATADVSALGAALLAGVGVGWWENVQEACATAGSST